MAKEENDELDNDATKYQKCGKTLRQKKELRSHVKHCGDVECPTCLKKFKSTILLNKHIKVHKSEHLCNVCNKSSVSKQTLSRHATVHDANKRDTFKCDKCNNVFSTHGSLNTYEKIALIENMVLLTS